MIVYRLVVLTTLLPCITSCFASVYGDDFYKEKDQKNKYFIVDRKNVDFLTPATVLSLRDSNNSNTNKIPEYLSSLCMNYPWMNQNRIVYIFESSKYSAMFDSFGIENIKKHKPIEKFIATYNPDDKSVIFYPLLNERRKKVFLDKDWCRKTDSE